MKKLFLSSLVLVSFVAQAGEPRNEYRSRIASEKIVDVSECSELQVSEKLVDVIKKNKDGTLRTNKSGEFVMEPAVQIRASTSLFIKKDQQIETYVVTVTPGTVWNNKESVVPNTGTMSSKAVVERKDFSDSEEIVVEALKDDGLFSSGYNNSLVDALKAGIKAKVKEKCENYRASITR